MTAFSEVQRKLYQDLILKRMAATGKNQQTMAKEAGLNERLISDAKRGPRDNMTVVSHAKLWEYLGIDPREALSILGLYRSPSPIEFTDPLAARLCAELKGMPEEKLLLVEKFLTAFK